MSMSHIHSDTQTNFKIKKANICENNISNFLKKLIQAIILVNVGPGRPNGSNEPRLIFSKIFAKKAFTAKARSFIF